MTDKKEKTIGRVAGILAGCIAVNLAGKFLAQACNLPVWLDMTGTCLAACFLGLPGALAAALSCNLLFGLLDPGALIYAVTGVFAAFALSFCVKKGYFEELHRAAVASFWIGIISVCISTPINLLLYEGYSGNMWGDALYDMLGWNGVPTVFCAIADEMIVEIVDKQICVLLAFAVIRVLGRRKAGRSGGEKKALSALLLLSLLAGMCAGSFDASAKEDAGEESNFAAKIFNNSQGMMSSEANVIEETPDGYIWIGSYAGLTRYDGREFEFIRDGGIASVTCLMTDSRGRLWIGTNDSGVARYEDGAFTFFTAQDGLPVNSIRAFSENERGEVYIGTTDRVCKVDNEDRLEVLGQEIFYVISMESCGSVLYCVDNNGRLFALRDDDTLLEIDGELEKLFCNCVRQTGRGLLLGTSERGVRILEEDGKNVKNAGRLGTSLEDIIAMDEDRDGNIWMCAETGIGFLRPDSVFEEKRYSGFDSSFEWVHADYQGNIWVASSRYGVLKLSDSRFENLFERAGAGGSVVNAVTLYQGAYYCGTDSGLVILDKKTGAKKENDLTKMLQGVRIRCLMADGAGRLWICSYSDYGLLCLDAAGNVDIYDVPNRQMTSNRVRCALELSDGTVAAGTAAGINFIRDGKVFATLTAEDGLANTQILSMAEGENGVLYAGTDGGGLYAISDCKIVREYTTKDGLSSNVILRVVPYDGGLLLVTSNALCYGKGGEINVLRSFPYFNNYDIVLDSDTAYVLSSAGIYVVDARQLCRDMVSDYVRYSTNEGLVSGLVANSWNHLEEDGSLYFCCNDGVTRLDNSSESERVSCLYGVTSVLCDGESIACGEDGVYRLPRSGKRVIVSASVRNYALSDIPVCFYIEGIDDPEVCSYQELAPVQLTNLPAGRYVVHFQILTPDKQSVLEEKTYVLEKEMQVWEHFWYKVYLFLVCVEVIVFAAWTVLLMVNSARKKEELERMRKELEEKVREQTEEIRQQQVQTVTALSDAVDAKDYYTSGHSKRVAVYARMLAERMGKDEEEQEEVYRAALLHDVGKIRIPEEVINKPGKLTPEEYELIKIHPVTGYHILKGISGGGHIAQGARFHHERYDGGGYPNGLQGENIPEVARIIGVADAYDAMASNRSYRKALAQEIVRGEIEKGKGTQFDPKIADIMLGMIDGDTEYSMRQTDEMQRGILVVDDEPENAEEIREILKSDPMYEILSADSFQAALELLERGDEVHLIMLDAGMSEADGFDILSRIREIVSVPVVFLIEDMDIETMQKAVELGVDDYLTKPFLPLVLREVVHSILNGGQKK